MAQRRPAVVSDGIANWTGTGTSLTRNSDERRLKIALAKMYQYLVYDSWAEICPYVMHMKLERHDGVHK